MVRYRGAPHRGAGRPLDEATAWGLVYELAGEATPWLSACTRSRNRARLRSWSAAQLALAVSGLLDGDAPVDEFTDAVIDVELALRDAVSIRLEVRRDGVRRLDAILARLDLR